MRMEEVRRCLDELDNMAASDKNDLSVLNDCKQAIIARQTINEANGSCEIFDVAFRLYDELKDLQILWRWVQKSKARSISDPWSRSKHALFLEGTTESGPSGSKMS